jgi:dTDP-4-amino-4,6-dideoxygalactose transaminase
MRQPIPLFDLQLSSEEIGAVTETLRSGWLTMGPRVQEFERAFAEHLGTRHAVAVSSGTAALHLAYLAAGIGPGDEVIVPSFTFVATVHAILYCGATPVFADIVGLENPSIEPSDVEHRITTRTRAVTAVHYAGYSAPVDVLRDVCLDRGLALIEDAAHAPDAHLGGRRLGAFGLASAFSLYSNKVLSVGEGGLLVTDSDRIAARARQLRSLGLTTTAWERHRNHSDSYDVVDIGFSYRMDEPRAALGLARLRGLHADVERRRQLTLRYRERLAGHPGLTFPYTDADVGRSSCYVMPMMVKWPEVRSDFRRALLDEHGVQTSVLYPAIHQFTAYARRFQGVCLPQTERAARCQVAIPLYSHMTAPEQDHVVKAVTQALTNLEGSGDKDPNIRAVASRW